MPFDNTKPEVKTYTDELRELYVWTERPTTLANEPDVALRAFEFARREIGRGNWTKDVECDGDGNYCVLGHIARVVYEARDLAQKYLAPSVPQDFAPQDEFEDPTDLVVAYNDHPDTTAIDMINLLNRAIDNLA